MPLTTKQNRILHVAKAKLKLSDEAYRSALVHIAQVTSATDLNQQGFEALMGYFEWCGFEQLQKTGPN